MKLNLILLIIVCCISTLFTNDRFKRAKNLKKRSRDGIEENTTLNDKIRLILDNMNKDQKVLKDKTVTSLCPTSCKPNEPDVIPLDQIKDYYFQCPNSPNFACAYVIPTPYEKIKSSNARSICVKDCYVVSKHFTNSRPNLAGKIIKDSVADKVEEVIIQLPRKYEDLIVQKVAEITYPGKKPSFYGTSVDITSGEKIAFILDSTLSMNSDKKSEKAKEEITKLVNSLANSCTLFAITQFGSNEEILVNEKLLTDDNKVDIKRTFTLHSNSGTKFDAVKLIKSVPDGFNKIIIITDADDPITDQSLSTDTTKTITLVHIGSSSTDSYKKISANEVKIIKIA